jgi:hypothetical protein
MSAHKKDMSALINMCVCLMDLESSKSLPADSKNAPNPPKDSRRDHQREADQ